MNIQETTASRLNLLKERRSLWARALSREVVEEWHHYYGDDEDLSDVDEDEIVFLA